MTTTIPSVGLYIINQISERRKLKLLCYWLLVAGYWLLVIGYWLLVAGYWLLVAGYWLLVTSNWKLVTSNCICIYFYFVLVVYHYLQIMFFALEISYYLQLTTSNFYGSFSNLFIVASILLSSQLNFVNEHVIAEFIHFYIS